MNEVWKEIPGYAGRYEVSNFGRVRSFVTGTGSKGAIHYLKHDLSHPRGYRRVTLSMNRKKERIQIHRLVANLFIGPAPSQIHQVNHKDFDTSNNRWDNLEWTTAQENHAHALDRHPRGITHGQCRLSEENVREIRALYASGKTQTAIAKQFGISQAHCQRIVVNKIWTHLK